MADTGTLELSALGGERPKVLIKTKKNPEGTYYEMIVLDDIGILQSRKLGTRFEELGQLMDVAKPTPAQEDRASALLNELTSGILPEAPIATIRLMGDLDKMRVVDAFFGQSSAGVIKWATERAQQQRESS